MARRILGEDVTQIEIYTERVKRMVGKVLTGNGITRYERGTYDLVVGGELSEPSATSCWSCAANALTLSECSAARRCWAAMVYWVVSTPEITLNRGAGPGGDTGAKEVLIFCPDSAFQLQA